MAILMDGKSLASKHKSQILRKVQALKADGITPGLAVILVGEDPASQIYVKHKGLDCAACGLAFTVYARPEDTGEEELLALIASLNGRPDIHGIIVQMPLPRHLCAQTLMAAIDPRKDVDVLHPQNIGKIMMGTYTLAPATPSAILAFLDEYGIDPAGRECVVVGRSDIVGKPAAMLLLHRHGTVTLAHSRTRHLGEITRRADILVCAAGQRGLITGDMIKPGAVVIDVAINKKPDGKRLCGDVVFDEAAQTASHITPVPGGVGPMTRVFLLWNTVKAAQGA